MVRWTLYDTLAFLLLLSLLLPSLLIMFIPSTFKRPVSSWKALNLRKDRKSGSAFLLNRSSDLFLLWLCLLLRSLLIMLIPSTFKRPVSSWKALNVRQDRNSGSAFLLNRSSDLFLLLLSLLLPSLLIMFIPSTFKRPVSSWKALNLRKTLLMASSVRLKPLNCSRLPCVYAQETLTFLLTQKKTCVKNYVQKE